MKLSIWLAKDEDGSVCIFFKKPTKKVGNTFYEKTVVFARDVGFADTDFEWLTYENSPKKVFVEAKLDIKE